MTAQAPKPITTIITEAMRSLRPGFTGVLFEAATIIMMMPTTNKTTAASP